MQHDCQMAGHKARRVIYLRKDVVYTGSFGWRRMPQRINSDRVLLSTSEAMQVSGFSREHIQRLLRSGRLEGVKLGHDWLVFEDALLAFIAQPRKPGPKGPHKKLTPQNHQVTQ